MVGNPGYIPIDPGNNPCSGLVGGNHCQVCLNLSLIFSHQLAYWQNNSVVTLCGPCLPTFSNARVIFGPSDDYLSCHRYPSTTRWLCPDYVETLWLGVSEPQMWATVFLWLPSNPAMGTPPRAHAQVVVGGGGSVLLEGTVFWNFVVESVLFGVAFNKNAWHMTSLMLARRGGLQRSHAGAVPSSERIPSNAGGSLA